MKLIVSLALVVGLACACDGQQEKPLLLQKPTVSRTRIVFAYGDELWIVGRDGGDAVRLTSDSGVKTDPKFSPDGELVAFSGQYDGNFNVFVVPSSGGQPHRLTYYPATEMVVGWTPDGKSVLFRSQRSSSSERFDRLFSVPADGGPVSPLPLPMAEEGSYSSDGSHLAYVPYWNRLANAYLPWKRYGGGLASPIWIADLSDSRVIEIPHENSTDFNPMWVGDKIYFLSDRNGPVTLFTYDTASKKVVEVIANRGLDLDSASAGPGVIAYEQFGSLHLFDPETGHERTVPIHVNADLPQVRPQFKDVSAEIIHAGISPTGVRGVFEARGEILTVPAANGDVRNLTESPGTAERDPAWSPDGRSIAYFSDESGEYALQVRDQSGRGPVKKITMGTVAFFYSPQWSPDSKKIAYVDNHLNLWYVDIDNGIPVRIDQDAYLFAENVRQMSPSWSPDSRWIVYNKLLSNLLRAVVVYSLDTGKSTSITDGSADAKSAVFDKNGKYLYFTASTDIGPLMGSWELSTFRRFPTRSVYLVLLRKEYPSPLAPDMSDEKPRNGDAADAATPSPRAQQTPLRIDFEDISRRIVPLPIAARNYTGLFAGKTGQLFLLEAGITPGAARPPSVRTVHKFDVTTGKDEVLAEGVQDFHLSDDGEKCLYRQEQHWAITPTAQPARPGQGLLNTGSMQVWVDPRAEWKQMYEDAWRIERDFFYDSHLHGLDWRTAEKKYKVYLDSLASRADLNYLFNEMFGALTVSHLIVGGGDIPRGKSLEVGLLGADFTVANGRYRFARIYNGDKWSPELHAPLAEPGIDVRAGDYLLAVNGREVTASDDVYKFFVETADKPVRLKLGSTPDDQNNREVSVTPIADEGRLRVSAWMVDNMHEVDRLSGGRLAYVYLPDTNEAGYDLFNRFYFSQLGKQGAVIDERFNGGGQIPDTIIQNLQLHVWSYHVTRDGFPLITPTPAIFGPKVLMINQFCASGGDALAWYFRHEKLGSLVGERTWGGLVGVGGSYPILIDGGQVTTPRYRFMTPDLKWDVENVGVPPDYATELDPHAWRQGQDVQLQKAVKVLMEELKSNPPTDLRPQPPAFPNYNQKQ